MFLVKLLQTYRVDVRDHDHKIKVNTLIETAKPVAVTVSPLLPFSENKEENSAFMNT